MIVTSAGMKEMEERAFREGCTAESLMEQAGTRIARLARQILPVPGRCAVFFGKGHNGGDALVAGRYLAQAGWEIQLCAAFPKGNWAELTAKKYEAAGAFGVPHDASDPDLDSLREWRPTLILDGLLGIGSAGPLRPPVSDACRVINQLRLGVDSRVISIDLPTGLDADTGAASPGVVVADCTACIGFAKAGLLADCATAFAGRLAVLPLPGFKMSGQPDELGETACPHTMAGLLPRRAFTTHKGQCGRVGIIAGSAGFLGAAILASEACVHAGAGLVTLYVTPDIYPLLASKLMPEVMVHSVRSYEAILDQAHDVLAIGPGLGKSRSAEVLELLGKAPIPMIVDADALNILAPKIETLCEAAGPRLLTPHPGEMARLLSKGETSKLDGGTSRRKIAEDFTAQWPVTLLLKGSRTVVAERGRPLSFNTTGNPGMATGGMGDVLTGVCAGLVGQGLALYDAARLGAWICGRAAEIAIESGGQSEESLAAGHLGPQFGRAFKDFRDGCW